MNTDGGAAPGEPEVPGSGPVPGEGPATQPVPGVAPGDWHRVHPATPLLRGGVVLIAIIVWLIVQLRDVVIALVLGDLIGEDGGIPPDPMSQWVLGNVGLAIAGVAVVLIVILVGGWLSWRMHTYRIGDDTVEEREGIIWRKHRRARLDRIQGVNVERPLLARIFGLARVVVTVAGEDANVRLSYLKSSIANALRAELLAAASRARYEREEPEAGVAVPEGVLGRRLHELTAPEFDAELSEPDSIVRMDVGRLLGSTAMSIALPALFVIAAVFVPPLFDRGWGFLFALIPAAIAFGVFAIQRVTRSLRYSIASTPDGIRVGFGLLSTTNETLPPGRIHAIDVIQPLMWRPFGWWSIRINRASRSTRDGAAGQAATTILPVGDAQDVERVIGLILPGLDLRGAFATAEDGPSYVTCPPRAKALRWFSWRRNGYAMTEEAVLLRKGAIWRTLTIVPFARVQSVALSSGPLARSMRLSRVGVQTVTGPIAPTLGALDEADAHELWRETEARTLRALAESR